MSTQVTITHCLFPPEISTNWPVGGEKRHPGYASQDKRYEPRQSNYEPRQANFDKSVLPSAPRRAIAAEIDMSRLPNKPPYTIYLGNLSYECSEDDIHQLFERKRLRVCYYRIINVNFNMPPPC